MPETTSYGARQDRHMVMREILARPDRDERAEQIEALRHIIWCNATKLNDAHRARIGAGLRALGVKR